MARVRRSGMSAPDIERYAAASWESSNAEILDAEVQGYPFTLVSRERA